MNRGTMDEHGHIKTQFDDLLDSIKNGRGKPVSVHALAAASGMTSKEVLKWVNILEKDGKVRINNSIDSVYVAWTGASDSQPEPEVRETKLDIEKSIDVGDVVISRDRESASDRDILIAQHHEERARIAKGSPLSPLSLDVAAYHAGAKNKPRASANGEVVGSNGHLQKIEDMISSFRGRKKHDEAPKQEIFSQPPVETEAGTNEASELLARIEADITGQAGETIASPGENTLLSEPDDEPEISVPGNAYEGEEPKFTFEKMQEPAPAIRKAEKLQPKIEKIEAPQPVKIAGVPVQFSEKLALHLRKIEEQTNKIREIRSEKEKLLSEQYLPIQRKLESELDTVGDRILRMEKNIMDMQRRATEIPAKVGTMEKIQLSTVKAHEEIRKAYDEASALIEESNSLLSEERDKIESILEKGRQEIAQHRAKTNELQGTLERITQMEEDSAGKVTLARETLAEQARQLASAEKYSTDLRTLKTEIQENIGSLKASVSATKSVLGDIERQMGQMRQIEGWSDSIREDYNKRISELDDYIREGNREFDTLRESVEANFVRKYLKELRTIANSYEYEFDQAKATEKNIDQRIAEEKARLEELFEEGRRISHIFEGQSRTPEGAEKFQERKGTFDSLSELSGKRSQVEELIAQATGRKPAVYHDYGKVHSTASHAHGGQKRAKAKKKGRR